MRSLGLAALLVLFASLCPAQPEGWSRPFPGHRVIGNLYAVGTYDLGVFLITSDEGHILVNTALEDSVPLIRRNVESLGFRLEDIKILLQMQAHWDHTAALAEIKRTTGARMWATAGDAPRPEHRRRWETEPRAPLESAVSAPPGSFSLSSSVATRPMSWSSCFA